ncbi:3-dehydroquinate synthase [Butyrivibrio sp. YAB3001]|uniref:3-dehydroquinate synthase n=1 Tax=Butyrivibrio sp. YAB3001 TaxID=1520812 RepID=UPI0008F68448|nr:3-dehydroquinate synthase [Butyrivibrio sp. YAB3001]SFB67797.1 3-dehydroquinate synthase [Butyrivibrio sp. YAB3001]
MSSTLTINYEKKPCYDIIFTTDFSELSCKIDELGFKGRKIAIITDSNVSGLYADEVKKVLSQIASNVIVYAIPAGEDNKNLNEVKKIYQVLIENHFDRHDLIVALGGGVVGDMAGFTAATYLRGISFVQVPTTLLAQTDSSIGGKTGVDFDGYKNMVGAFHMPRLVYTNVSTLKTLPERQFASGFAEVMKHGLIKDQDFYTWLLENMYEIGDKDQDVLIEMIMRSCEIKKAVVEKDPTEKGDRALLNFGHTLGHAIEKAKNFELYHGECVALGCVAAAFISWKKELISMEEYYEIRDMFVPFNLPISVEEINPDEVIALTKSDKKADQGSIKFILLKGIGKSFISTDVSDSEMKAALEEILYIETND